MKGDIEPRILGSIYLFMEVRNYIRNNWKKSIRTHNKLGNSIDVPYPYNSPCSEGLFDELYYWDTYFLNRGLLQDDLLEQARNNILDISYLISKFGFMPNAARVDMLTRSQPPYFVSMVNDYYLKTNDKNIIELTIDSMNKEMEFWINNRTKKVENTLVFQYKSNSDDKDLYINFVNEYKARCKKLINENEDKEIIGRNALAECESGWDFSSRFNQRELNYVPIDLNSLMYFNLLKVDEFNVLFNYKSKYNYKKIARKLALFLKNHNKVDGVYYDYDFVNNKVSSTLSMASFYPFKFNLFNCKRNYNKLFKRLVHEYGLSSTEKEEEGCNYQWGYPNMWPPLILVAFDGAININNEKKATELALIYTKTVEKEFAKTNKLWEKYDVNIGSRSILNEYSETEMLGWTAGCYNVLYDYLKEKNNEKDN